MLNSFCRRIAVSRARSFLCAAVVASATGTARPTPCGCVYLCDMPRHSLIELLAIRLSPQAGKSLVMRGSLRFIPQKRISRGSPLLIFISQGSHTCCCDLPVLERAHAADPQATYDHTINLQRHTAFGGNHAGEDEMYQSAALHRIFRDLGGTLKRHCCVCLTDRRFHTAKRGVVAALKIQQMTPIAPHGDHHAPVVALRFGLFRWCDALGIFQGENGFVSHDQLPPKAVKIWSRIFFPPPPPGIFTHLDRKSTRLNSSHL